MKTKEEMLEETLSSTVVKKMLDQLSHEEVEKIKTAAKTYIDFLFDNVIIPVTKAKH